MKTGLISIVVALFVAVLLVIEPAFAEEGAAAVSGTDWKGFSLGLALGIAAIGGALGQGKIISAALDAIARNPGASGSLFLPWLLGVAFVETLVLLVWLKA